ncbi:hypothetical protein AB0E01_37675 [Nocardia vinacea]|uniref:hypothetical protein n=1 Tax=Nocardia vinacea TaxID=96468 RepID=UPI0033EDFBB7
MYSDLARRKKSLPVAAAMSSDSPAGREFRRQYTADTTLEPGDFAGLAALITEAGGLRWAEDQLAQCCATARTLLATIHPDPNRTAEMLALIEVVEQWN